MLFRSGESQGVEYNFVSNETFHLLMKQEKVIEYRKYDTIQGEWIYFTVNDGQFDDISKSYLLIGTLEQFNQLKKFFGKNRVEPIYIEVSAKDRLMRSINRESKELEPKYSEICRRFLADEEDFSEEKILDAEISKRYINSELRDCYNLIREDIKAELK